MTKQMTLKEALETFVEGEKITDGIATISKFDAINYQFNSGEVLRSWAIIPEEPKVMNNEQLFKKRLDQNLQKLSDFGEEDLKICRQWHSMGVDDGNENGYLRKSIEAEPLIEAAASARKELHDYLTSNNDEFTKTVYNKLAKALKCLNP